LAVGLTGCAKIASRRGGEIMAKGKNMQKEKKKPKKTTKK
jgi:hypothetical protein